MCPKYIKVWTIKVARKCLRLSLAKMTASVLTLIVLEGDMADVAIDHGMGSEVRGGPGALEQRHGGTYYCCL